MLEALKNKVKNYGFSGFLVNTESFALITGVSFEKRWLAAALLCISSFGFYKSYRHQTLHWAFDRLTRFICKTTL